MRILMLGHSDSPWVPHYSRFFSQRGDDVLVVSFAPNPIEGIEVAFVGAEPFDFTKNKHTFITRVPKVRRIIRRFQPNLVHASYLASNGLTAVLAWREGPIVVSAVGSDVLAQPSRDGLRRWAREARIKFVGRRATAIHTVSQELHDRLIGLGIPASKLFQISVGADVEAFRPSPEIPRPQCTRLICTRKHNPVYDNATILDALAKLKKAGRNFHCLFLGDGTLHQDLKDQAEKNDLSDCVTFSGNLPHEQIPGMLQKADIYVSASLSDGTSVSLLEAMLTGLVPVVSRIAANKPWIDQGRTGLMFDPGCPDSLGEALAIAMDDRQLQKQAYEENPKRVRRDGNMQKNMDRTAEIFEQIAAGRFPAKDRREE
jgi:L-malate glycosyltransferase